MGSRAMEPDQYNSLPLYLLPNMYQTVQLPGAERSQIEAAKDLQEPEPTSAAPVDNVNTNVYYTGLDPTATKDEVMRVFNRFGRVVDCKVLIDRATGKCRGAGLVRFETRSEAEAAIAGLRGVVMPGSINNVAMVLRFADTPEEKVRRTNRRLMAHVYGQDPTSRYNPMEGQPVQLPGIPRFASLAPKFAAPPPAPYSLPPGAPMMPLLPPYASLSPEGYAQYSLFVGGLPMDADDSLLFGLFGGYGPLLSVKVTRGEDGACKGYGFVNFMLFEHASAAVIGLNGRPVLDGKTLVVAFKGKP